MLDQDRYDLGTAPLAGIRVLDLTKYLAGPYCTMLLADAGAEVIKIEKPGGDVNRTLPPIIPTQDGAAVSAYFLRFGRGKKSVELDIWDTNNHATLRELIASSDVLVDNFRAGTLERIGLNWAELLQLNSQLVYASISGFGNTEGPYRERPAFNIVAEAMAGITGTIATADSPPQPSLLPVGDSVTSINAVASIALALFRRERCGQGARVDIAMYDTMLALNEWALAEQSATGNELRYGIEDEMWFAPHGFYRARDGWICLSIVTEQQWAQLCTIIDRSDLFNCSELSTGRARARNGKQCIRPAVEAWLKEQSRDKASQTLAENGVPAAPLRTPGEVLESDQAAARGMFSDIPLGGSRSLRVVNSPIKIDTRNSSKPVHYAQAGEHTEEILHSDSNSNGRRKHS